MFRRILIANRGEIAVRIARACQELGIESVAVHSDVDAGAPHVAIADRAVAIGPAPARDSYLNIGRIIDAARATDAEAVHPGYGFLAENAAFAAACADAGLVFVGPPPDAIERMGDKIEARRLMEAAGVPTVPGEAPPDQSDGALRDVARRIGFPLLVKAAAGGGGKGMRRVDTEAELAEALASARREATAAFGNGTLYVERCLVRPRHVEIQILADHHDTCVHLFERDCSVQRRHQKVIEESPAAGISAAVRDRMGTAAIAAARAVGYRNAGTIEFLVEGAGDDIHFHFLEMNTRLQVEHAVTEAVTGVDLVAAQLRVAAGEPLSWHQASLNQRGCAIECRVYAEDSRDMLPQAGRILRYVEPTGPGVRVDSGIAQGSEITVHYDPLLAKVITWGETREAARARAHIALREFAILGIDTNVAFLVHVLDHPRFRDADIDTGFLEDERATLVPPIDPRVLDLASVAAAADGRGAGGPEHIAATDASSPWATLTDWRV